MKIMLVPNIYFEVKELEASKSGKFEITACPLFGRFVIPSTVML